MTTDTKPTMTAAPAELDLNRGLYVARVLNSQGDEICRVHDSFQTEAARRAEWLATMLNA